MAWVGQVKFSDKLQYFIENTVAKLNSKSTKEDWLICISVLKKHKYYIWNSDSELFPSKLWTLMHHVAYYHAPISIIQSMKIAQYPMSLPDSEGKLPLAHVGLDAAESYRDLFKPVYQFPFVVSKLKLIELNFHAVICEQVNTLIEEYDIILPVLSTALEDIAKLSKVYFEIPGMFGGFSYWFDFDELNNHLIGLWCVSSSKVIGNSAKQLYYCSTKGWKRINENNEILC